MDKSIDEMVLLATGSPPAPNQGGPERIVYEMMRTSDSCQHQSIKFNALFYNQFISDFGDLSLFNRVDANWQEMGRASKALQDFKISMVKPFPNLVLYGKSKYLFSLTTALFRSLKNYKPKLIHAHEYHTAYLASKLSSTRPVIFTSHSKGSTVTELLDPHFTGTLVEKYERHLEREAFKVSSVVTFPSMGAKKLLELDYPNILEGQDVRIIHNGIDVSYIDGISPGAELKSKYDLEGKKLLLCVANYVAEKGLFYLIEAIAKLETITRLDLRLLLIGKGKQKEELERYIQKKGLKNIIHVVGVVPNVEIIQLLKVSHGFVLPSLISVFDLALLEAMAASTPIVTTAVGGNLEMLDAQCALLVQPKDSNALASAIENLLRDTHHNALRIKEARRRLMQQFTLAAMISQYESIYRELGISNTDTIPDNV